MEELPEDWMKLLTSISPKTEKSPPFRTNE
jgi:hypothetical protein